MFNKYLLKSLPAEYIFAGYNVKRGLAISSHVENNKMVYDVFKYTYLEDKLSFYILFDDGKYKNIELDVKVDEIHGDDLISRHLFRGESVDPDDYEQINKDELAGVFGIRKIPDLIEQIDALEAKGDTKGMKAMAMYDIKKSYTGLETNTIISRFNTAFSKYNGYFTVPAINYSIDDPYQSIIGDEIEYFDLISNKSSDEIVDMLREMAQKLDGVGNRL